jgi:hypothetical protein
MSGLPSSGGFGLEKLPREAGKLGIRIGIGPVEVAARAHDAVEIVSEFDVPAKEALVNGTIPRGVVREADAPRMPLGSEELAQHPERYANRKLGRLPNRTAMSDHELFAQHDNVGGFLDVEQKFLVGFEKRRAIQYSLVPH